MKNNLILKSITYRNFKCLTNFTLEPNSGVTEIFGPNGSGKTTLFDGFTWLLFGKNSKDDKKFSIKPIDLLGNDVPNLEIEVAALIDYNGREVKLQKIQKENWVKKSGHELRSFEGNTTDYYVDEVPCGKSEFNKKISEMISEDAFKMITSLTFFPNMHWNKQRDMLFQLAGEITDSEIEASNEKLTGFIDLLDGKSFDDFKKMISKKIKLLKEDIEKIPVRMDEVNRSKPETPEFEKVDIDSTITELKEIISTTDESLSDIMKANKEVDRIIGEINRLKIQLSTIENIEKNKMSSGHRDNERELQSCIGDIDSQKRSIVRLEAEINQILASGIKAVTEREDLLKNWHTIHGTQFIEPNKDSGEFVCNCCGQLLPSENIEQTINKMRVSFENKKVYDKDAIQIKGRVKADQIERISTDVAVVKKKIEACEEIIATKEKEKKHFETLLSHPTVEKTDFNDVPQWISVNQQINDLTLKIKEKEDSSSLLQFRNEKSDDVASLEKYLLVYQDIEKSEKRVVELQSDQSKLSAELLELERQDFKCEEYVKTKVNLSDEQINGKFKNVRFKLFNKQVNGGVAETCEALVNTNGSWVPYADANTAGQINAGLDIVNTLCNHYGITAPIFMDHGESITHIIKSDSQLLRLIVSDCLGIMMKEDHDQWLKGGK